MTDKEALNAGHFGDGGCLGGGTVKATTGLFFEVFEVGRFVIEKVYAADLPGDAFVKERVCGIGVRFGFCCRLGDPLVLDDATVLFEIALAPFEPVEEGGGDFVAPGFFGVDATEWAYFAKAEAPAGDAMVYGETGDLEFWFPDDDAFVEQRVKAKVIGELYICDLQLQVDDVFEGGGRVEV